MPFQGNGTFARIYRWQTDAANGLNIAADRFDAEDDGFATGLSNCITRDGQSPPTASIPWGNQNLTGVNALSGVSFAFSGAGTIGGTLGVTGAVSLTAGITVGTTLGVTGAATVGGTLAVTGAVTITGGLVAGTTISDGRASPAQRAIGFRGIPVPSAITTSYTLVLGDAACCLEVGSGGSITIPPNSSVAFTPGDTIILQETAGATKTITPGTGVTLRQTGTTNTGSRTLKAYGQAMLRRSSTTDLWFCAGDLT
jgi:hypothetical protein